MKLAEMDKKQLGYLEGVVSSILNTLLFGFKLWVGLTAGSVAMIADAWHTLSDTLTSLVVILGFWVSGKPKDQEHPFGHGRAELVASVIIGTLLAVVGINFLNDSIRHLRARETVVFGTWSIIVFSVSVLLKESLARFSMWAGRKIKSQSLIADAWHHRSDALASLLIIIGALVSRRFWWMDGALGILVSLLILWAAFTIIKTAFESLLGEEPDKETIIRIRELARECSPNHPEIHHLHLHRYGDHVELTVHARQPENMFVKDAHDYASALEKRIRDELGFETTIHIEPEKGGNLPGTRIA